MTEGDAASGGDADPVTLGLQLIACLEHDELALSDVMDRVEAVTRKPNVQRKILNEAEVRGLFERDGETVRPHGRERVDFDVDVVARDGEFTCERCSEGLSTGYFIKLDDGEVGPYGSTCIRKVTGRA